MTRTRAVLFSFVLLFSAFFSPLSASQTWAADRGTFCLQTFNVYGPAYATNVSYRLQRLADTLLRDPCDAYQFQEFWRSGQFDDFQAEMKPARLAMTFADRVRGDQAMVGLATGFSGSVAKAASELYRVNNEDGFLDWIRNLTGVQKGILAQEVRLDHTQDRILFVNTHTHPNSQEIRLSQMVQLVEFVLFRYPGATEMPLVLSGDFNAKPDSLEIRLVRAVLLLNDAYLDSHNGNYGDACTYCKDNPLSWDDNDRVIDFALYRSGPATELFAERSAINLQGDPNDSLSDHYGLRAWLGWSERKPELLDERDPVVVERKAAAAHILHKVAKLLVHADKRVFQQMGEHTAELETKFLNNDLPESVQRLYRMR